MTITSSHSLARTTRRIGRIATALLTTGAAALATADDGNAPMLALGDSVVFGFIEQDGYAYVNPGNFLAYPEIAGRTLHLDATNPSCPGETSASFLSMSGADNGCRGYRASFPLHESYAGTQMEFARSFLSTHRNTRLVTLSLGANDGFLLQAGCKGDPACVQAGLPTALATLYGNLNTALSNLRASGFKGVLMVVNYYSLDYSDPAQTGLTTALNQTLVNVAAANGAIVADAFTAFRKVATSPFAGGNTCRSGLLNGSAASATNCDVHPSLTGQRLLAKTVQAAYLGARRMGD